MDKKEVFAMLEAAAPVIYQINFDKGFWKEGRNRNKLEATMLVVTELAEMMEAHRKSRRFPKVIGGRPIWAADKATEVLNNPSMENFAEAFTDLCKDTLEDEAADAAIRILDIMHGYERRFTQKDNSFERFTFETSKNFGEDLFRVTSAVMEAGRRMEYDPKGNDWSMALRALIAFSDIWKIDILTHVRWKMEYNKTRELMHGKAY